MNWLRADAQRDTVFTAANFSYAPTSSVPRAAVMPGQTGGLTATVTIDNQIGANASQALQDSVAAITQEAIRLWSNAIAGTANINVTVRLVPTTPAGTAEGGGPNTAIGGPGGTTLQEPTTSYELRTGVNPNGATADIVISIAQNYLLNDLWFDPTPSTSNDIPVGKTDALSVLVHEVGHTLGFIGYWNEATSQFAGGFRTPYDYRHVLIGGEAYFSGPNTAQVYGGPVPLTNNNYTHYGNTVAPPGTSLLNGLMNGTAFYTGTRYDISDLDLAFLADMGIGTTRNDIFDQTWLSRIDGGPGTDIFAGNYSSSLSAVSIDVQPVTVMPGGLQLVSIERFQLTLTGLNDTVSTGDGDDTIVGGGGADNLSGGNGNDLIYSYAVLSADSVGIDDGPNYLNGGDGNDELRGSGAAEILYGGGEGDDILSGRGGADIIDGGDDGTDLVILTRIHLSSNYTFNFAPGVGGDIVEPDGARLISVERLQLGGGSGVENVTGGINADTLFGGAGNDILSGGGGNDTINGEANNDTLAGQDGDDSISGGDGDDTIVGGAGVDSLLGGNGNDSLYSFATLFEDSVGINDGPNQLDGGVGNDLLRGSGAAETLLGGDGDDSLGGRGGADVLNGGIGSDLGLITRVNLSSPYTFNFAPGVGGDITEPGGTRLISIERLQFGGGSGDENVTGGANIDYLDGGAGNDALVGAGGDDIINGEADNDTLAGQDGADQLNGGEGNDAVFGGLGLDDMYGGGGDDLLYIADNDGIIDGGGGYDQAIVLTGSNINVTLESGIEYVAGNSGNDTLSAAGTTTAITIGGADGNDILTGGTAGDILAGMNGTDTINGGDGNDQLFAGAGSDNFFGGEGDDLIYILGNDGIIQGGAGYDRAIILDAAGVDIYMGNGIEYCAGNAGRDILDARALTTDVTMGGAGGEDLIYGGSGNDILSGSFDSDEIQGWDGNDILFGGDSTDYLVGGPGNDQISGGGSQDIIFLYDNSGNDSVTDFENGSDLFWFVNTSAVHSFADLVVTALGSDALVTFAGGQLFIIGAAGQIDASDFIIQGA